VLKRFWPVRAGMDKYCKKQLDDSVIQCKEGF